MLKTRSREKLLDAIIFFASHTKNCGKTKLFKLLYLLDFEHFRQTGRSVTDLDYLAYDRGPMPASLDDEWDDKGADMAAAFEVEPQRVIDFTQEKIVPKREFDPSHFTNRELAIMKGLADKYCGASAKDMVKVTHAENGPWARVYGTGAGRNRPIPYEIAADGKDAEAVIRNSREFAAFKRNYG